MNLTNEPADKAGTSGQQARDRPRIRAGCAGPQTTLLCVLGLAAAVAQAQTVPVGELEARRETALSRLPREILVAPARPALAEVYGQGFRQDANFLYLTGLRDTVGAVLLLDGPARECWLFQPASLGGLAEMVGLRPSANDTLAERSGIDHVVAWDQLVPYVRRRLAAEPGVGLRLARAGFDEGVGAGVGKPPGLTPDMGARGRWRQVLAEAFPGVTIVEDTLLAEMRSTKGAAEIALLRQVGTASASALLAGLRAIRPGRRQREVEAAIVGTCLTDADGVSFWPWAMSGPAAVYPEPWNALRDPLHLDRLMQPGELVRVDVGCTYGGYMGDVGRTVPVSGTFSEDQRETWDLLVDAYRSGLAGIRDGVRLSDVVAASKREIAREQGRLKTALARRAASIILSPDGAPHWQLHGVGLDVAEGPGAPTDVLKAGMVVDYEPIFSVDGQGFYLEDMLVVTTTGYEVLTPGLPYGSREIEQAMRAKPAESASR